MANTTIGQSIVIEGEISGEEDLVIHGTVKGRISLGHGVRVEPTAVVEADIETESVQIAGSLTGNVAASDRIEIQSGGRMIGDIRAPRIHIADGAVFKGNVDMDA